MATINIWKQFKALMPKGVLIVATLTENNSNETHKATLRDGSTITVKGGSIPVGEKVFIQNGEIKGSATNLTILPAPEYQYH